MTRRRGRKRSRGRGATTLSIQCGRRTPTMLSIRCGRALLAAPRSQTPPRPFPAAQSAAPPPPPRLVVVSWRVNGCEAEVKAPCEVTRSLVQPPGPPGGGGTALRRMSREAGRATMACFLAGFLLAVLCRGVYQYSSFLDLIGNSQGLEYTQCFR
jgi:hypothetical protein